MRSKDLIYKMMLSKMMLLQLIPLEWLIGQWDGRYTFPISLSPTHQFFTPLHTYSFPSSSLLETSSSDVYSAEENSSKPSDICENFLQLFVSYLWFVMTSSLLSPTYLPLAFRHYVVSERSEFSCFSGPRNFVSTSPPSGYDHCSLHWSSKSHFVPPSSSSFILDPLSPRMSRGGSVPILDVSSIRWI